MLDADSAPVRHPGDPDDGLGGFLLHPRYRQDAIHAGQSVNSALFAEAMPHVFDPRGFMYSNLLHAEGAPLFGVHVNAIFIFLVPLFRVWPDYRLLLFISDVALALSAIPAYLIARRYFSAAVSLLLAAMVILHPIMMAQPGRSDISELRFMPVLFLTAFYLFEKRRFWCFRGVPDADDHPRRHGPVRDLLRRLCADAAPSLEMGAGSRGSPAARGFW